MRALTVRPALAQVFWVIGLTALYSTFSVRAQLLGRTHSYDLGIFTQGVQGWARGTGPISSIKGQDFSLLGDHFSPVTALIAPAYAVFPTPVTLLVAQAVLIALSAVPISRLFGEWFGRRVAFLATASYGLSFGVLQAVGFDFHEVAFGAPLLAFGMAALARRRPVAAAAWTAPLVLVKEDMGFTVAAVGLVLLLVARRRVLGAGLAAFGLIAVALEVKVIIPAFSASGRYAYSGQLNGIGGILHALFADLDTKAITVLCLIAVGAFVALRSPLILVAVPTVLWRFASANANYYGMQFHYGLLLMPIVFVALADGIRRFDASGEARGSSAKRFVSVSLVVSLLLIPTTPFITLLRPTGWQQTPQAAAVQRAAAMIPTGATVAASDTVVPQIVSRTDSWLVYWQGALDRDPEWVLIDTVSPAFYQSDDVAARVAFEAQVEERGWHRVLSRDGVYLLRR